MGDPEQETVAIGFFYFYFFCTEHIFALYGYEGYPREMRRPHSFLCYLNEILINLKTVSVFKSQGSAIMLLYISL